LISHPISFGRSGVLAPRKSARVSAYWTGLFNWLGNIAGDSSFAFIFAQFVSAALITGGFDPLLTPQLVGLAIAVLFVWSVINCYHITSICWVNNLAALVQAATIISLVTVVLVNAPSFNTVDYVLREFNNDTGFEETYYVIILSILFPLFGFVGYDGPAHLAEETKECSTAAPLGIIYTVLATGIFGFLLILVLLITMQDIEDAIDGYSGNAATQIISQNCGQFVASVFAWMLVVNIFFCGCSSVTVTSRIWFALCRDKATIFSEILSVVNPRFGSPIYGIAFIFIVQSILLLLPLNSDKGQTAFISIVGITVVGLQISYAIPIFFKVFSFLDSTQHAYVSEKMKNSDMALGILSLPLGILSCLWLFVTTIILLLPTTYPITSASMNFTVVAVGFVTFFGVINWEFNSKHTFRGPPRDDDDVIVATVEVSAEAKEDMSMDQVS
jgi:amino acid transporter